MDEKQRLLVDAWILKKYPNDAMFLPSLKKEFKRMARPANALKKLVDLGLTEDFVFTILRHFTLPAIWKEQIEERNRLRKGLLSLERSILALTRESDLLTKQLMGATFNTEEPQNTLRQFAPVLGQFRKDLKPPRSAYRVVGQTSERNDFFLAFLWYFLKRKTGKDHWTVLSVLATTALNIRNPMRYADLDAGAVKQLVQRASDGETESLEDIYKEAFGTVQKPTVHSPQKS